MLKILDEFSKNAKISTILQKMLKIRKIPRPEKLAKNPNKVSIQLTQFRIYDSPTTRHKQKTLPQNNNKTIINLQFKNRYKTNRTAEKKMLGISLHFK
jgi:hypothetical protein